MRRNNSLRQNEGKCDDVEQEYPRTPGSRVSPCLKHGRAAEARTGPQENHGRQPGFKVWDQRVIPTATKVQVAPTAAASSFVADENRRSA